MTIIELHDLQIERDRYQSSGFVFVGGNDYDDFI